MIYYMSFGKLPSFQKSSTFLEKKYNRQPESKVVLIQLAGCRLALTNLWHSIIAVTFNQSISVDWYLIDWSACFYY
jgi:hypothetical protein